MAESLVGHFGRSRYRALSVCFAVHPARQEQRWYRETSLRPFGRGLFCFLDLYQVLFCYFSMPQILWMEVSAMDEKHNIAKTYDPGQVEDRLYQEWMEKGYFHAEVDENKDPFCIVIPPPNITGQLHMGHALDNTLQDIMIRWKRMQGYSALWMPGTDHASIAT
jgi:hypothetical protein